MIKIVVIGFLIYFVFKLFFRTAFKVHVYKFDGKNFNPDMFGHRSSAGNNEKDITNDVKVIEIEEGHRENK